MPTETIPAVDWPVRAFVEPIRSVLFIDDQFPTFDNPTVGNERDRAVTLWAACRRRGWLCDIDNATEWSTREQVNRLTASDLLVVDYHLIADDAQPALTLLTQLAERNSSALVAIYTADPGLDEVLNTVAAHIRGVSQAKHNADLGDYADLEGGVEWSTRAIRSFLGGGNDWKAEFEREAREKGLQPTDELGERLLEKHIHRMYNPPLVTTPRPLRGIAAPGAPRWLQCGNVFAAVIGKARSGENEVDTLLNGFKSAVQAWKPAPLTCLSALSRHEAARTSVDENASLTVPALQEGLQHFVNSPENQIERERRARQISADLLRRRFELATNNLGLEVRTAFPRALQNQPSVTAVMHLNAFMCAERHSQHHLSVGTVFRSQDEAQYWVCVTPACDMEPRPKRENMDPWGAALGDILAMTALRLDTNVEASRAAADCERGRHLFFHDVTLAQPVIKAALAFHASTADSNPRLEHMFAKNLGRKDEHGNIYILRSSVNTDGELRNQVESAVVVCQLRAPYAERLTHMVGSHVSRVGVDFLSTKVRP